VFSFGLIWALAQKEVFMYQIKGFGNIDGANAWLAENKGSVEAFSLVIFNELRYDKSDGNNKVFILYRTIK